MADVPVERSWKKVDCDEDLTMIHADELKTVAAAEGKGKGKGKKKETTQANIVSEPVAKPVDKPGQKFMCGVYSKSPLIPPEVII